MRSIGCVVNIGRPRHPMSSGESEPRRMEEYEAPFDQELSVLDLRLDRGLGDLFGT